MALPSTVYSLDVQLCLADQGLERTLLIKVARHPSETLERLWLRVLAYCWQWEESIAFGPGLCAPEEPDVLALGPDGTTRTLIVRVGRPELARVEKDCTRGGGARVAVLFDSTRRLAQFVEEARAANPERVARAELAAAPAQVLKALTTIDQRRAKLGITFADDHLYLELDGKTFDGPLECVRDERRDDGPNR